MSKLTLFVPGFFGPVSETHSGITPNVPAIEKYFRFSKSNSIQTTGFTQTLFQLFGFPNQDHDYPVAAVTRLVDDDHDLEGIWKECDPGRPLDRIGTEDAGETSERVKAVFRPLWRRQYKTSRLREVCVQDAR